MSEHFKLNIEDQIATLTLNRPEVHNAFDDELIANLTSALKQIENHSDVRLVVLTSTGKHFSAGADLNWMKRMATLSENENREDAQQLAELMYTLNALNKPTLAVVKGAAYGGAVGLIACCDMAIATEESRFCLSEVKIGLSPAVISPFVLNAMGERAARRYCLTGEIFSAAQAKQLGLLHEVAKDETELHALQHQFSTQLLANSPQAVMQTKQLIQRIAQQGINQTVRDDTVNVIASIRVSDEGQEGLSSFLEKRQANWVIHHEE